MAGHRRLHPWTVTQGFDSPSLTPRWVREVLGHLLAAQQAELQLLEARAAWQQARPMELLSPHAS